MSDRVSIRAAVVAVAIVHIVTESLRHHLPKDRPLEDLVRDTESWFGLVPEDARRQVEDYLRAEFDDIAAQADRGGMRPIGEAAARVVDRIDPNK